MTNLRREIWYQGHVQGVGFRYTVAQIARQYPVTGYVRNLPDGRVHLLCEGQGDDLQQFLDDVADRMQHFIQATKEDRRPALGNLHSFEIRV